MAGIYPFLALLSHPEMMRENRWLLWLRALSGLDDRRFLIAFGAACLAVYLASSAFLLLRQVYLTRFSLRQIARIATRLLRSYLSRPYAFFLDAHSAEIAKNVVAQSDAVANGVLLSAMTVFSESFVIATLTGLILWVNPAAGLVSFGVLGGLTGLALLRIRGRVQELGRASDEANARRFTTCLETLQSVKEIKAANAESFFCRSFEVPSSALADAYSRVSIYQLLPSPMIQSAAVAAMMGLTLWMIAAGRSLADVVPLLSVYAAAGFRLMPSLSRLSVALALMRQNQPILDNVASVLAGEPDPLAAPQAEIRFESRLELRAVRFAYPRPRGGRPVLDGVDLDVPRGAFVALAGGSGAGKTTLADVILGLLAPQEGSLLVDGRRIGPEDLPAWRRRVGYIPQSLFLFDDTIAANIAFGEAPAQVDRERVRRAARLARLDELVASLPEGYDTRVGERASRLSGGQRQRLGIARALYRDPDLLVLDEPTSALDGITEAEILATLRGLRGSKTILVIAHRPATIRDSDLVVLLKDGRVAAAGRYEELAAREPHFAALMSHVEETAR